MGRGLANWWLALPLLISIALPASGATLIWTGAAGNSNWFDTNNWNGLAVPAAGDSVFITNKVVLLTNATAEYLAEFTITNATLVFSNWDAALRATNVNILGGGTLTHLTNSAAAAVAGEWIPDARVQVICSNFTLAAGGAIQAEGRGFKNACGPGHSPATAGASHGGRGGASDTGRATNTYGSVQAPTAPGSGADGTGGAGGGAVRIEAAGAVVIDGLITAKGGMCPAGYNYGPGSGGAISIACQSFGGGTGGLLQADGGDRRGATAGGGGGGRIAVIFTNAIGSVGVRFSAMGGVGLYTNQADLQNAAQMGSLFLSRTNILGDFFASAGAWQNQVQGAWLFLADDPGGFLTNWSASDLTLSNVCIGLGNNCRLAVDRTLTLATNCGLFLGTNSTVSCSNLVLGAKAYFIMRTNATLTCSQSAVIATNAGVGLEAQSAVTCGGNLTLQSSSLLTLREQANFRAGDMILDGGSAIFWTNPVCHWTGSLTLTNGASLTVYSGATNALTPVYGALVGVTNNLVVARNCWMYLQSDDTNGGSALLQIGDLAIHAGGGIDAAGRGFRNTCGPGCSPQYAGASYGGLGAYGTSCSANQIMAAFRRHNRVTLSLPPRR